MVVAGALVVCCVLCVVVSSHPPTQSVYELRLVGDPGKERHSHVDVRKR